jgi:putative methyltransferase (TIGR04325 family)
MPVMTRAHQAVERAARWPLLEGILRARYDKQFAAHRGPHHLFRGVYPSFQDALASAPADLPLGYDHPAPAAMYLDRTRKTFPTDYPVLYWLGRLLRSGCTSVMDLGGHIGVSYYAYRKYLDYPPTLRWRVHDVPAVMAQGREFAREKDKEGFLGFADDFAEASGMDIVTAQGSLQYLPDTLPERLERLPKPPPHLILNLTPLHERVSYFTLQSIGAAYCPYRITAIADFLRGYEALGYRVVDSWENPDKKCEIPFHEDHSLERYYGFYLRREAASAPP